MTIHSIASFVRKNIEPSVWIGLLIRLFLAWFLPWAMDHPEKSWIQGVAYTDIDYHVFNDAARYIQMGKSPYDRTTYRYTPFLAALLAKLPTRESARYLFCIADTLCGWIILRLRRRNAKGQLNNTVLSNKFIDAVWWLYNPLAINICTRGSAESFLVLLPVLLTTLLAVESPQRNIIYATLAGICHGIAVHAKLYPIIYTLSYMAYYSTERNSHHVTTAYEKQPAATTFSQITAFLRKWTVRMLRPEPLAFFVAFLCTFLGTTYLAVQYYGTLALKEGLLYHFSRVDHRHNYSMHWYWIYLARASDYISMAWVGRILLLPQLLLLLFTSLALAPSNLYLALFVQTFLFVAQNKVITAQYFTWYLCLLPLCSDCFTWTRRVAWSLLALFGSISGWLASAYTLEMLGMAVHRLVWIASILFFLANVNLLAALLESSTLRRTDKIKIV